jgi:tetratricopeptide (TPR) repeat protein
MSENDEPWTLFKGAWIALDNLIPRAEVEIKPEPIKPDELNAWLQANPALNATPLMIISLAYYLFKAPSLPKSGLLKLTAPNIFRYFSEREVQLITSEVEDYVKINPNIANEIEPEGTCLLKAIAAITGGLNATIIRNLGIELKLQDLDYQPPHYKHLNKLSLLVDGVLPALHPDIFAADFLAFCLEKYSINQEAKWIFAALRITKDNFFSAAEETHSHFDRLNRLAFDSHTTLAQVWPVQALSEAMDNQLYSSWIALHMSKESFSTPLKEISPPALTACINREIAPEYEALYLTKLADFLMVQKQFNFETVTVFIQKARAIYDTEIAGNFDKISPNFASIITVCTKYYQCAGDYAEALDCSRKALQTYRGFVEQDYSAFVIKYTQCLDRQANILTTMGDLDAAVPAIEEAVYILNNVAANFPQNNSYLAQSLITLANCLARAGKKNEGLKYISQAHNLYKELAINDSCMYEMDHYKCLFHLRNHIMLAENVDELIKISYLIMELGNELPLEEQHSINELMSSFTTAGNWLLDVEGEERKIECRMTAKGIYEKLSVRNFSEYGPIFADYLTRFSNWLYEIGHERLRYQVNGAELFMLDMLYTNEPDTYRASYAISMIQVSILLAKMGNYDNAISKNKKGIEMLEIEVEKNFTETAPWLVNGYRNLYFKFNKLGNIDEANHALQKAQDIQKQIDMNKS